MNFELRKSITTLKRDRQHGAGWITLQALRILEAACLKSNAPTIAKFNAEIADVARTLIRARPVMVSLANYSLLFQEELAGAAVKAAGLAAVRRKGVSLAQRLIKLLEKTTAGVARNTAGLVKRRYIIMTGSYSSAVCDALELARRKGIDFKVLAVESRYGRISYGKMMAERFNKAGIECRLVPDAQINWHVARANIILLGADSVSLHGWLINGSPSLEISQTARRKKVPVYSVCETAKFDVRGFLAGLKRPDPGFDMVPLELVTGIVTERGLVQPDDVYRMTTEDIFGSR